MSEYIMMDETPHPQITVMDVFVGSQQSNNMTTYMLGFGGNVMATSAIHMGIPGIASVASPSDPINPASNKAIVLSMGAGRKYIIGYLDQLTTKAPTKPGETTIYSSTGNHTRYLNTGIYTTAAIGDIGTASLAGEIRNSATTGIKHTTTAGNIDLIAAAGTITTATSLHPTASIDAIITAYNALATNYNLLLTALSTNPVAPGAPALLPAIVVPLVAQILP